MVKASNNNNKYRFIMQCFYKIKVYECALFVCQMSFFCSANIIKSIKYEFILLHFNIIIG